SGHERTGDMPRRSRPAEDRGLDAERPAAQRTPERGSDRRRALGGVVEEARPVRHRVEDEPAPAAQVEREPERGGSASRLSRTRAQQSEPEGERKRQHGGTARDDRERAISRPPDDAPRALDDRLPVAPVDRLVQTKQPGAQGGVELGEILPSRSGHQRSLDSTRSPLSSAAASDARDCAIDAATVPSLILQTAAISR